MNEHEFDSTFFCIHCGQSMQDIKNKLLPCYENVIAISHIRAKNRIDDLIRQVLDQ